MFRILEEFRWAYLNGKLHPFQSAPNARLGQSKNGTTLH
ncbi:hypothetical protein FHU20_004385 [Clostridium saccharobutylicum]|nr:hypothetical protein [Clostridium saccharobutylicum]MBA9000053.1 hypothetical protein [Clostridium saccharobutylicum]NOV76886.1 hypothetical protein [Clostridium saccharobutylicum]NOW17300.1 hypothetical protein [Clostridium saccharobutylicum]NOW25646.1 hypothetical protein [Clostridium saccharobutylicum]